MNLFSSLILTFFFSSLHVWAQTVQDDWTAPAAPDGSTPLLNGAKFTLLWKSTLQNNFKQYCPSCDPKKLDLWITNFNGTVYKAKIARGLDVTTTVSWDWTVGIASDAFSGQDWFVFRFTFFDSSDPYTQQISSPGFKISGLVKASSTAVVRSSSTTSALPTSSSTGTTSPNATPSSSSTSQPTSQTPPPTTSSKSKAWLAGAIGGPIVGIAALMWCCFHKRKQNKLRQSQAQDSGYHYQQHPPGHDFNEGSSQMMKNDHQPGYYGQHVAEVPGTTVVPPAELWQGNYGHRT